MRTKNAIYQDYLGPSPIFDNRWFQQIFQISQNVYDLLKTSLQEHSFFNVEEYDICGQPNICNDAKILLSLKHLGYMCMSSSPSFSSLSFSFSLSGVDREGADRISTLVDLQNIIYWRSSRQR